MLGEDHLNIKMQLIIGALKLAEFPDHILNDYDGGVGVNWKGCLYMYERQLAFARV